MTNYGADVGALFFRRVQKYLPKYRKLAAAN